MCLVCYVQLVASRGICYVSTSSVSLMFAGHLFLLGRIECMRCEVLRSMIPASNSLSISRTDCAKTAEQIDVLFGVKTSVTEKTLH